jgi:hypothetical protein
VLWASAFSHTTALPEIAASDPSASGSILKEPLDLLERRNFLINRFSVRVLFSMAVSHPKPEVARIVSEPITKPCRILTDRSFLALVKSMNLELSQAWQQESSVLPLKHE